MRAWKDITGQKFGRLTARQTKIVDKRRRWKCKCECGRVVWVRASALLGGWTLSCGCLHKERVAAAARKHPRMHKPTWISWHCMKERCLNPEAKGYHVYGGRGIGICERWLTFDNFLEDMGPRPPRTTINRLNNDRGYEPGNCEWASDAVQRASRRPFEEWGTV